MKTMNWFGNNKINDLKTKCVSNKYFITPTSKEISESFKTKELETDKKNVDMKGLKKVDKNIRDHPFVYDTILKLYENYGLVTSTADKYTDYIMGPGFFIKSDNEAAATLLNNHITETQLYNVVYKAVKLACLVGTQAIEMNKENGVPVAYKKVPTKSFYLKVNKKGEYLGGCQILKQENITKEDVINLDADNLVVLRINAISHYGIGIINPALCFVNDLIGDFKSVHTLLNRKANSPIMFTLGAILANGEIEEPSESELTGFKGELEYLNNKTEFAVGPLVKQEVIDFGNVGEKFDSIIEKDFRMYYGSVQIPEVLTGVANVAEGLADVQGDAFDRRIQSIREELEKDLEEQLFKKILVANGMDAKIDIVWGLPSERQKKERLTSYIELLKNPMLNMVLREEIEKKVAEILEIDRKLETPEEEKKRDLKRKQPQVPGQANTPPKQVVKKKKESYETHVCGCDGCKESANDKKDYTVREWVGFQYDKYEDAIKKFISEDEFEMLLAKTELDVNAGLLTNVEVNQLRLVLLEGINDNKSMQQIARDIKENIRLRDRYIIGKDGKIVLDQIGNPKIALKAGYRPMVIARNEIIRVSNEGLLNQYDDADVEKVSWIAANSERTCEECEALNGQVFPLNEARGMIPIHIMCRCTWGSVAK